MSILFLMGLMVEIFNTEVDMLYKIFKRVVLTVVILDSAYELGQSILLDCTVCTKRRLGSACASTQSDQSFRCSPEDALNHWPL